MLADALVLRPTVGREWIQTVSVKPHEAGIAQGGTLAGDGYVLPSSDTLRCGSFGVSVTATAPELVVETTNGSPRPEQVMRLLHSEGVVRRDLEADVLVVVAESSRAEDLAIYRSGLRHRLLYERTYDESKPRVVWFGFNPFLEEMEGVPDEHPARPSFRHAHGMAQRRLGQVGTFTIFNLFTRRSGASADIAAAAEDALDVDALIVERLASADLVIAAWGGDAHERHLPRIRQLWSLVDDAGHQLMAPSKAGELLLTRKWPRQPRHPSRLGYTDLAPLPPRWIESFAV